MTPSVDEDTLSAVSAVRVDRRSMKRHAICTDRCGWPQPALEVRFMAMDKLSGHVPTSGPQEPRGTTRDRLSRPGRAVVIRAGECPP
jgi:hypothetical protein